MRYLPLDAVDRGADAGSRSAFPTSTPCSPTFPRTSASTGLLDMPRGERNRGGARARRDGGEKYRGGIGAVFPRRRRLSPPCSRDRRSSDPALGIPDELHALSAGNRAGHAAGPVRIPDAGRRADGHGGRQRLDVRRLDRLRRSDADGASPDAAHQGGPLRRPASAIRRCRRDARQHVGRRRSCARPTIRRRPKTSPRSIDDKTSCVIVQNPDFFGNLRDLTPIAAAAHAKGALLIAVFTEAVSLGAVRAPGEMGADIVVGEGQSIGNALNFGGPYVGLFATHSKIHAPDAGPPRRRDGRRGGPPRLRADAVDARAAHPSREGDEQHLHEFRPLRARVLDPSDAARRDGPAPAGDGQSRQRGRSRRTAGRGSRRRGDQRGLLQRIHDPHAASRRRRSSRRWPRAASSPAFPFRGSRLAPASTICSSSPAPRSTPPKTARPTRRRCANVSEFHGRNR